MRSIIVIAHNLRSTHNVGSLLRTADAMGVERVYLTGYTPYPAHQADRRLPHLATKLTKQIQKTALGAEASIAWEHSDDVTAVINQLRQSGYTVAALEQTQSSILLPDYKAPTKMALILGREVEGLERNIINAADLCLEIPMLGKKESLNVVQAAAMAMYHCQFGK